MSKLTTSLQLSSNVYGSSKNQSYTTTHEVTSAFDTTFKINNADGLKQLIDFKPDGTKLYNKFNYLLLANDGNQSAEIQILLQEFGIDDDIIDDNPNSATIDFILHPGKYFAIPSSKMFIYGMSDTNDLTANTDTSAGNMNGTSPYDDAYDGSAQSPTFIDPPGYFIASQLHGNPVSLTASTNKFEVDISDNFLSNLMIGSSEDGISNSKIGLFGDVSNASDLGVIKDIPTIEASTEFSNARLVLDAIAANVTSADANYIGAYTSVAKCHSTHTATVTTLNIQTNADGTPGGTHMFKQYDIIRVANELMQVEAHPTASTLTVTRGVLGTTAAAHVDNEAIGFHYMNNVLADIAGVKGISDMQGVSNIYTSPIGSFSANSFFGLGRAHVLPNGLVPGSIALKFYSSSEIGLGLGGCSTTTISGLTVSTAYEFKITVDGGTQTVITFTTDSINKTLGNRSTGSGVLQKIQAQLDLTYNGDVLISIKNGDIVFTGNTRYKGKSTIALAVGTAATAELFGTGIFPAITAIKGVKLPQLPSNEDEDNIMFDDGMGRLMRKNGGSGVMNYETGAFNLVGCPQNSHMKIACNFNSALSGNVKSSRQNYIPVVKARSLNAFRDAYVRVVAYDDIIDDDNVEILMGSVESDGSNRMQESSVDGGDY
tara:strand:+ start:3118 stop:5088 length:1971 start_codon:yes stop_codon:yes gene_type:complete